MRRRILGRAYCLGPLKRGFDLGAALLALLVFSPLLLLLFILLTVFSGWPVLFSQERVGLHGRSFRLLKFRTMRPGAHPGLPITGQGDPRVTLPGRLLRTMKLDELPQLYNVLRGEMSIVGPRPEIPRYVALYNALQRRVLEVRPGLTDPASLLFGNEEAQLGAVEEDCREAYYYEKILPEKLDLNLAYIDEAGFFYDLKLIFRTMKAVLFFWKS